MKMIIQKDSQCKIREMFILQWRRSIFRSFAANEIPLSRWLVVVAILYVDGRGNNTYGLLERERERERKRERERERERESSWSTIKQKERGIEIGGEINWDDVFYFATSYCKRTRIRKKNKGR